MNYSLDDVYADIITHLRTTVFSGHNVYEQSISDTTILQRSASGAVTPYVAFSFGDLIQQGSQGFVGPGDHVLPIYIKIVVPGSPQGIAGGRTLYSKCIREFLNMSFDWTGNVKKRAGGAIFPLKKSDGATEAVVYPVSFGVSIQLTEWP